MGFSTYRVFLFRETSTQFIKRDRFPFKPRRAGLEFCFHFVLAKLNFSLILIFPSYFLLWAIRKQK